jgi:hypothetical protein
MRLETPINVADLPVSNNDYSTLPDGWYTVTIKSAEVQNTKAGNGQYIKVRFDVIGESHAGRVVFCNLNIRNPNPKAEEIGRQQTGELLRAIGLATATDTDQLVGGNLSIKVTTRKSEQYGDSNEVKGFKSLSGGAIPSPAKTQTVSAKTAAPWEKQPAF